MRQDCIVVGAILFGVGMAIFMITRFSSYGFISLILSMIGVALLVTGVAMSEEVGRPQSPWMYPVALYSICPYCGNPSKWIPEYQRYYCYTCQMYL